VVREFPASSDAIASANARIRKALETPLPMHFPHETPLEDVLAWVKGQTAGLDGIGIPIYIDPVSVNEASKAPTRPVTIDVDGVPLKTTLRLLLNQLDVGYRVRGGVLVISSEVDDEPMQEDPFLLAGHCLLALLAACAGGLIAPLVTAPRAPAPSA
jgi:hypothetical protein